MAKHSESFKLEVVQRYLAGPLGKKALAKLYGIGRTSIASWVKHFQAHGPEGLQKKPRPHRCADFKLNVLH